MYYLQKEKRYKMADITKNLSQPTKDKNHPFYKNQGFGAPYTNKNTTNQNTENEPAVEPSGKSEKEDQRKGLKDVAENILFGHSTWDSFKTAYQAGDKNVDQIIGATTSLVANTYDWTKDKVNTLVDALSKLRSPSERNEACEKVADEVSKEPEKQKSFEEAADELIASNELTLKKQGILKSIKQKLVERLENKLNLDSNKIEKQKERDRIDLKTKTLLVSIEKKEITEDKIAESLAKDLKAFKQFKDSVARLNKNGKLSLPQKNHSQNIMKKVSKIQSKSPGFSR